MTMSSTALSLNPDSLELSHWNLEKDLPIEEDLRRERQPSWLESSSLLENRPSKYSWKKSRKTLGVSLSVRPNVGLPRGAAFAS